MGQEAALNVNQDPSETSDENAELVSLEGDHAGEAKKTVGFYDKIARGLEETEAATTIASKFMVDHIKRLERENLDLQKYRKNFYDQKTELETLKGRIGLTRLADNISTGMLALGSAGAGITASFLTMSRFSVLLFIVFLLIVVGSFFLKVKSDA
jgi:hypothetical protein